MEELLQNFEGLFLHNNNHSIEARQHLRQHIDQETQYVNDHLLLSVACTNNSQKLQNMQALVSIRMMEQLEIERSTIDFIKSLPPLISTTQFRQLVQPTLEELLNYSQHLSAPYSSLLSTSVVTLCPPLVDMLLRRGVHWSTTFEALNQLSLLFEIDNNNSSNNNNNNINPADSMHRIACAQNIAAMLLHYYFTHSPTFIQSDPIKLILSQLCQGKPLQLDNVVLTVPEWNVQTFRFLKKHQTSLYSLLLYMFQQQQ